MEPEDIVEAAGAKIGSPQNSGKWDVITAIFGWSAVLALVAALTFPFFGASTVSSIAFAVYGSCISVALRRDWIRAKLAGSSNRKRSDEV